MKYILLLLVCCHFIVATRAQTATSPDANEPILNEVEVDSAAKFAGGQIMLYSIINEHIQFPQEALNQGTNGRIITSLIIEKNGTISDRQILRGTEGPLTEEALRLLELIPDTWNPAMKNGKPVRYRYILPISFHIDEKPRTIERDSLSEANALMAREKLFAISHNSIYHEDAGDSIFSARQVDDVAMYPGGRDKMFGFLVLNLKQPRDVLNLPIQDSVLGCFVVEKDGNITEPITIQGTSNYCQAEVIRVISLMPKWQPATKDGQAVRMEYILPINFGIARKREDITVRKAAVQAQVRYDATETQDYEKAMELTAEGKHDEAMLLLNWITRSDPRNTKLLMEKGKVYLKMGKYRLACSDFKAAEKYGSTEAAEVIDKYCK